MGQQETEIIYCDIKHETDKAYLIDGYTNEEVWIPKSEVENIEDVEHHLQNKGMESVELELPEWLAVKKGLI